MSNMESHHRHHHHHHHHRKHHHHDHERHTSQEAAPPPPQPPNPNRGKDFKLLVDPAITKGATKLYRFQGVVPVGDPSWNVTSVKDPRSSLTRIWSRLEMLDLPVPRFKIDSNYVGLPPGIEVTISNLNDNIDKTFLMDLVVKYGDIEELNIYYHPVNRKHLGIARLVFMEVPDAAACVNALNGRSVMGKQLVVFQDPFGRECQKLYEDLTTEKKVEPVVEQERPPPEPVVEGAVKIESGSEDEVSHTPEYKESERRDDQPSVDISKPPPVLVDAKLIEPHIPELPQSFKPSLPPPHIPPPPTSVPPPYPPFPVPPMMPNGLPYPAPFSGPPPPHHMAGRPPHWAHPHPHHDWNGTRPPLARPLPPPQVPWSPPPRFMSPPGGQPPPPEPDGKLDLDTRIEMLLKGNFLAMDINQEEKSEPPPPPPEPPRPGSASSEEMNSPPPLPPGEDAPPPPSPSSPLSAYSPMNSPFADYSAEKYAPLSLPPSPFLAEEDYLESLLSWRLKHLAIVKQREKECNRIKKKGGEFESDKVSEISSDEDEADFGISKRRSTVDDDRMSLSSLSSTTDLIEEVTVPSNPYGSYTFGQGMPQTVERHEPEFNTFVPPPGHAAYSWNAYPTARYPGAAHLPFRMPFPALPPHHQPEAPELFSSGRPPETEQKDPMTEAINTALEKITDLLKVTINKDLVKRMTEALTFHELEVWWATHEKKYNSLFTVEDKGESESKTDTHTPFNPIIDSSFDGNYVSSGLGLGFRAALPKMPSFRRKKAPSPVRVGDDNINNQMNESDEEEMVQQSDSDGEDSEPETMMEKRRREEMATLDPSGSSHSESSDSDSESEEANSSSTQTASSDVENDGKEEFLQSVDFELLERMREKTPEGRNTPTPMDDFSDESIDYSKPPKTPDIHLSEEDLPRTPSPNGTSHLRSSTIEALSHLGLDELVSHIKIKKPSPKSSPSRLKKQSNWKKKRRKDSENVPPPPIIKEEKKEPDKIEVEKVVEDKENNSTVGEDSNSIPYIAIEHSYSRPKEPFTPLITATNLDHDYSAQEPPKKVLEPIKEKEIKDEKEIMKRKKSSEKLVSHLWDAYLKKPPRLPKTYPSRDPLQEMMVCYEFLTKGVDQEDMVYLKRMYDGLLADESQAYWMSDMHWVKHHVTYSSTSVSKRQKTHDTGCARTEGFYKIDRSEKQKFRHHYNKSRVLVKGIQAVAEPLKAAVAANREARSNQRRLLAEFGTDNDSDLLKFNQLKFRKKQLKFSKSEIHDWGLFAMEPIAADEMVIEYVGQMVRPFLADYREKGYEKKGIGSSYLFRIDAETIIDATHFGNLSRFINHSCNPNCYAKIITIESQKKIVIYSKKDIQVDEEITYDYKFPLEEEKIKCLCGAAQCKGFLN